MKNFVPFLSALTLITMSSCSVMAIQKHEPDFKTTRILKKAPGTYVVSGVATDSSWVAGDLNATSMGCRATTFNMPVGKTVSDFIRDALTDEIDAAEKLSPKGTPIAVSVKKLDSDTAGFSTGTWSLDFIYKVGAQSYDVQTRTEFESAFSGSTACENTARALTNALSDNFKEFFTKLSP